MGCGEVNALFVNYICFSCSKNELVADPAVRKLVAEQTVQWSDMVEHHRKEEWELIKQHLTDQQDILKRLMEVSHAAQMKQLEAKHDR
jgi:phosphatidylinositol phospholipase C beta